MPGKLRYVYRAYRYRLRVDAAELRFITSKLRPGQVAVDVGCHKGAYTYWMRRRVGPTGHVFAFEPQPGQVEYLRRVFAAMQYDNVTLVPIGLSNAPGRLPLHVRTGTGMTHAATFEPGAWSHEHGANHAPPDSQLPAPCSLLSVSVTTLDAFFADQRRGPDLIKIDVEGHESAVLDGALRVLRVYRPTILLECEARHRADGDVRPVFDLLESLGYRGSFFHCGVRRPLAEFNPSVHQCIDLTTVSVPSGYVNNFTFEP